MRVFLLLQHRDSAISGGRLFLACAAVGCLLAGLARAGFAARPEGSRGDDSLARYVARLESSYRGVECLRAEFTQTYLWGERKRVESGTVIFARGGRMRWEYREPEEKVFLSDGKKLELYIPAERQLTRSPEKSSEDFRAPFRLLLSRFNLRKVFARIEFADQALTPAAGDRVLRASPRGGGEEAYRQVLMEVSPEFDIRRIVIFYADRTTMEFTFDRIERNVALNPSLFRITPPPGTEIIER